jgi:hypothetical protein
VGYRVLTRKKIFRYFHRRFFCLSVAANDFELSDTVSEDNNFICDATKKVLIFAMEAQNYLPNILTWH